jgi:hypothetical protein
MKNIIIGICIGSIVVGALLLVRMSKHIEEPLGEHRLFTQGMVKFEGGWNNRDTGEVSFSFKTSIKDARHYFELVEADSASEKWKLLDGYGNFRLYIGPWEKSGPTGEVRDEIGILFEPKLQTVFFKKIERVGSL